MLSSPIRQFSHLGIVASKQIFYQLDTATLVEQALHNQEATLTATGALNMQTGKFTGRSPKDRFIVFDQHTAETVDWGDINQSMDVAIFNKIHQRVAAFISNGDIYARDCQAIADPQYAQHIFVVSTKACQDLFAKNMFIESETITSHPVDWNILVASDLQLEDHLDLGLAHAHCVALDLSRKLILIVGTGYTGEIKKSIFSVLNYILPLKGILSMHCSANVGRDGDTALFFGLSGTGKTTLSNDPERYLIGDDEHGWATDSIFNIEGGCYAKTIGLNPHAEPVIHDAIRFGALLENVTYHPHTRTVDYTDTSITENTRVSYPLEHVRTYSNHNRSAIPKNIFFLSADAFGVLPPISKLTVEQALYYFINGYTSKVAGTEMGIGSPTSTFSACFGAAFMPLHPMHYAELLRTKLAENPDTNVWLVNTGWIAGPYGVGRRIKLSITREIIKAALSGTLGEEGYQQHSIFGLSFPNNCSNIPSKLLDPQALWENTEAYDAMARKLKDLFEENYVKYNTHIAALPLVNSPQAIKTTV